MEERILIVANRLPYGIEKKKNKFKIKQSSGGLVSAVKSISNDKRIVWVGAADFKEDVWIEFQKQNIETDIEIVPLFLNKKLETLYYNGFANSVLWPLFHYFPSFTEYSPEYYEAYKHVNELFAAKVKSVATSSDIIWIHDYHLMLLPAMLKQSSAALSSNFFLHIPFPTHELLRLMPDHWRNSILKSLLCADVVGFHTEEYVFHFKKSLEFFLGIHSKSDRVAQEGHSTKVSSYPISIDFVQFHSAYDHPEVVHTRTLIRNKYRNRKIVFSLDRLDYSKGVINRLEGYEQLLKTNPSLHGKVALIINVIPSREEINRYAERKHIIEECISRINGVYGNFLWQPIVYQYQHLSFHDLIACYTGCDVALVTPLRDGMNLIAKEFVASRKDQQGCLILSELAGASNELKGALLVNPNDTHAIQAALLKAFKMKPTEQQSRMDDMQKHLIEHDVKFWANTFLQDVHQINSENKQALSHHMTLADKKSLIQAYQRSENRLILLDYDGTLVGFYNEPQDAKPNVHIKNLLCTLASDTRNRVVLISGRDKQTLNNWFGALPIDLVAEHGSHYKKADKTLWKLMNDRPSLWKNKVTPLLQQYTALYPGTFIEEKEHSIAWHYRACQNDKMEEYKINLCRELILLNHEKDFEILFGNKVLELRTSNINKGTFVSSLLQKTHSEFVLAIGDDTTDEDMFNVLSEEHHYTIKVGFVPTSAKYNLKEPAAVLAFLNELSEVDTHIKSVQLMKA
jgi:trehalose 6-phosphate synthase/phosphatase